MPINIKDKKGKTVTITRNFVYINNDEFELILFLSMSNI